MSHEAIISENIGAEAYPSSQGDRHWRMLGYAIMAASAVLSVAIYWHVGQFLVALT
jgi:hypothetical protein